MTLNRISHYQITNSLGQGGMGVVYKAIDQKLRRAVAIKTLPSEFVGDDKLRKRLMSEARAASRLSHQNICTIYEVDEADGILFIVMEYVEGQTLSDEIREGPIPVERVIDIAAQIASGLDKAHSENVIHRDIKPANIVLTKDNTVKILDFGLARTIQQIDGHPNEAITQQLSLTEAGQIVGTAAYMSPEQLNAEEVDARTDIFSLTVLLYEMLRGQTPFRGTTLTQMMLSILNDQPEPLSGTISGVAPSLDRIILKGLAKSRDYRYRTVKEFQQDLLKLKEPSNKSGEMLQLQSIAVLYFDNLSGASDEEYLRDGMTEDVITELSKIERLRVFPRSAVMPYRDKQVTAPEIGRQLNASYVLGGSLRQSGNRVRVTAQLVESSSGHSVWAERYDREMQDVFDLQDDLSRSIARALSIKLSPQEEQAMTQKPVDSPEAYEYFLRGRRLYRRGTQPDMRAAVEMFEKAIELKPTFALAYAGLGHVYGRMHRFYDQNPQWMKKGTQACERAIEIEPDLPEALSAQAFLFYSHEQYEMGARYGKKAIELKEDCEAGYYALGLCLFLSDRLQEVAALADRAIEVSGDDYNTYLPYISALTRIGEHEKANQLRRKLIRVLQWQIEWAADNVRARILLAGSYANLGESENAIAELNKALPYSSDDASALYNAACTYALLGQKKEALSVLKQCLQAGYWHFDNIARDPDFKTLHDEPEFQALINKTQTS